MANYTEPFQAVVDNVYDKLVYNAFHEKEATLLYWLRENCARPFSSAGEYFKIPFQYGHTDDSTDIAANPYATIGTTAITDQDALKRKCGGFVLPIILSNWEIDVLVGSDKNRSYDLALSKTKTRVKSARRILSDKLFSNNGTTATDIMGLRYIIDQTDTSYCGLTRSSSNTYGLYPVEDTSSTTLSWGLLENTYMDCSANTDVIITTKDGYGFVWALAQPQQRYDEVPKGKQFTSIGCPYIQINGVPIVWDERCPGSALSSSLAEHFFFLSKGSNDEPWIHFFHHRDKNWDLGVQNVVERTKDQEISVGRIKGAYQLVFSRCDTQAAYTAITG